jgi:transposase InsO family protein
MNRSTKRGPVVHAGHGVRFTSRAFTDIVRHAGPMASFGSVGGAFDNTMMETCRSTM